MSLPKWIRKIDPLSHIIFFTLMDQGITSRRIRRNCRNVHIIFIRGVVIFSMFSIFVLSPSKLPNLQCIYLTHVNGSNINDPKLYMPKYNRSYLIIYVDKVKMLSFCYCNAVVTQILIKFCIFNNYLLYDFMPLSSFRNHTHLLLSNSN